MTIVLKNFAIAGYRSFGKQPQYFDKLGKINLLIGRNNAGKSNVIRFLMEIYPKESNSKKFATNPLDNHLPDHTELLVGWGEELRPGTNGSPELRSNHPLIEQLNDTPQHQLAKSTFSKLFSEKRKLDGTKLVWSLFSPANLKRTVNSESWRQAVKSINDSEISILGRLLTGRQNGDRVNDWEPAALQQVIPVFPSISMALIPAIREIGAKGSESDGFDGKGIIEKLARLQNPDVHNQPDRIKFQEITEFVCNVIDNPTASIEVPHDRETILVHMDGKTLPLSSLGSGIHEVIILAAAATVLSDHLICIEEPEIHLNPILQKKLIRYLSKVTRNQYVISTHSAALMDTPDAEIYHVRLEDGCSIVERATSNNQKSAICEDLGFHPSDLLQANCVIWVEGPSDRVYLNYWINMLEPNFVEGIHYSVMFYGGRLASHLSNDHDEALVGEFISLRRLNRRGVMILDSDRNKRNSKINQTKRRLEQEFNKGPGHAWITKGREIENYLPTPHIQAALSTVSPNATPISSFDMYENVLKIKSKAGRETQAPKVDIARYIVSKFEPDLSIMDLRTQINKLIAFIKESNPSPTQ
jgi:energy-coupling factor transporter ATP-binding protein EcfA2